MEQAKNLLVHSLRTPMTPIQKILENRGMALYVSRSLKEAESVYRQSPSDIKCIFVDTDLFCEPGWHSFMQTVTLSDPEAVFLFFDPRCPETMTDLLGEATGDETEAESESPGASSIIGKSEQLNSALDLAERYAPYDMTVLITGETGTGKELIASRLHSCGLRKDGPFVSCNLAAIPETLVESELFGYKKGAFTGADADKKGLLEAAEGGTLFLDEIGEINHVLQVKLLRLLENGEYFRIGDSAPKRANVRIVAATNKELEEAIAEKDFRQDLFYRLNGCRIILSPLRDRKEDIMMLAEHFIERASRQLQRPTKKISSSIAALLMDYAWPGNIRELKSVIESAFMVSDPDDEFLVMGDLPMHLQQHAINRREKIGEQAIRKIDEAEKCMIEEALQATDGNKDEAARLLGISLRTLYRKLEKFTAPDMPGDVQTQPPMAQ